MAKTAADYPITFGYGAKDGYYYGPNGIVGPYHRGDDRAMDVGTPVVVNGTTIGLTGISGTTSGSHLHIGRFIGATDTNPKGGGFTLTAPVVVQVASDGLRGKFVAIRDISGATWYYLHLSKQNIKVGDKIGEENMTLPKDVIAGLILAIWGDKATADELNTYSQREAAGLIKGILGSRRAKFNSAEIAKLLLVAWRKSSTPAQLDAYTKRYGFDITKGVLRDKQTDAALTVGVTKDTALKYVQDNLQ